jgi:hypothetical protein
MSFNNLNFSKQIDSIEKKKIDIAEETLYVNLMVLASQIIKQHPATLNGYEQEILKVADLRIKLRYNMNS